MTDNNAKDLIVQIMKGNISFVPQLKKDFPATYQHGIVYKAIPNVIIKRCPLSPNFLKLMLGQENYLEGKECKKNILIHPSLDITDLIELYRRQDATTMDWLK